MYVNAWGNIDLDCQVPGSTLTEYVSIYRTWWQWMCRIEAILTWIARTRSYSFLCTLCHCMWRTEAVVNWIASSQDAQLQNICQFTVPDGNECERLRQYWLGLPCPYVKASSVTDGNVCEGLRQHRLGLRVQRRTVAEYVSIYRTWWQWMWRIEAMLTWIPSSQDAQLQNMCHFTVPGSNECEGLRQYWLWLPCPEVIASSLTDGNVCEGLRQNWLFGLPVQRTHSCRIFVNLPYLTAMNIKDWGNVDLDCQFPGRTDAEYLSIYRTWWQWMCKIEAILTWIARPIRYSFLCTWWQCMWRIQATLTWIAKS
jgi:hypothetical protein